MERRITALLLCLVVIGGILVILWQPWSGTQSVDEGQTHTLRWGVKEGDIFVYEISGWNDTGDDYHSWDSILIEVEVTYLPTIPDILRNITFHFYVVEPMKIACSFLNGSRLPYYWDIYKNLVSFSMLPVGDWDLLDSFYPDQEELHPFTIGTVDYLSEMREENFLFGGRHWDVVPSQWYANVSLTLGVPLNITCHIGPSDIGDEEYSLTLDSYQRA
ncbi:MAG: hypothetical protein ACFFD6_05215 [Candidatus Thorarchaeota archaeon]